jgi:hypothetical protein
MRRRPGRREHACCGTCGSPSHMSRNKTTTSAAAAGEIGHSRTQTPGLPTHRVPPIIHTRYAVPPRKLISPPPCCRRQIGPPPGQTCSLNTHRVPPIIHRRYAVTNPEEHFAFGRAELDILSQTCGSQNHMFVTKIKTVPYGRRRSCRSPCANAGLPTHRVPPIIQLW